MRLLILLCLAPVAFAAAKPQPVLTKGIKTPGVQIPFASLKAEAEIPAPAKPAWIFFSDSAYFPNATGLEKVDAKIGAKPDPKPEIKPEIKPEAKPETKLDTKSEPKPAEAKPVEAKSDAATETKAESDAPSEPRPSRAGGRGPRPDAKPAPPLPPIAKPCAGMLTAFTSLWIPSCGEGALLRFDPKTSKETARVTSGVAPTARAIAASSDSIWLLTDEKTTLSRIDPDTNQVVGELRLPAHCTTLLFGETALWLACPAENKIYRIDPSTNLVTKEIEVAAGPQALAAGEGSIWVLCKKEGKVARIDPKTNKVTATIELAVPGAEGAIAVGEGFVWVTQTGFPLTRISPVAEKEKVLQQFTGKGGGAIELSPGAIWLSNIAEATVWKIDPKRVIATLAE